MSNAGKKLASPGVTVTQEKNAPVKPGKLSFNPNQAAFGNGYAQASNKALPSPVAPIKFVTDTPKSEQHLSGQAVTLPEIKIVGTVPIKDQAGLKQQESESDEKIPNKPSPESGTAGKSAPIIGPDGAMVFDADPLKDKITGSLPKPDTPIAADDALSDLAPVSPDQVSPTTAKVDDVAAKATKAMTKPANAETQPDDVGKDQDTAKPADGPDKPQFAQTADQPVPIQTTKDEAPTSQQDAAGGGGGGADLAAWKSKVSGAIAATPKPTLGNDAASSITVMSATGKGAGARYRGGVGGGAAKDVKKSVRPPPPTPKPLPKLDDTVVSAADREIDAASDKKLPDQELPLFTAPPKDVLEGATTPMLDVSLGQDLGTSIALPEPPQTEPPAAKADADAKSRKKLKDAKAKEPEPKKGSPGQKMVLQDIAPPITPQAERGTKGQSKETFRLVLGEMLRKPGPEGEAKAITDEARDEAYPSKAVTNQFPEMGDGWKDPVKAELESQVKAIADMAGISQDEMAKAVTDREAQLAKLEKGELATIDQASKDAGAETKKGGEEAQQAIGAARLAQDQDILDKLIAANGETDPQVIQMRRDMGVRQLTQRAARQDVNYEKSGDRRARALDASLAKYRGAYETAGRADEKSIYQKVRDEIRAARPKDKVKRSKKEQQEFDAALDKADSAAADEAALAKTKKLWEWVRAELERLKTDFGKLKETVTKTTTDYRTAIKAALGKAKTLLNDWADKQLEAHESWWDSLVREFRQWAKDAQGDAAAWEEARNEQLRDAVAGDLQLIADLEGAMRQRVDLKAYIQERGLDAAQLKVVQKFFKPVGPEGKQQFDSIGAVAEGMRARVRTNRKPGMIERFKTEVMAQGDDQWDKLGFIGNAERPPFNVKDLASKLFHAMNQWGTEEKDIFAALANLTPLQARALRACYKSVYSPRRDGRSLDADLAYEMGGEELDRAKAQLEGNQALADAAALAEAFWGPGTDEATVMSVLRNKTPAQQDAIRAEYKRQYGRDLDADLKSELDDGFSSHHDLDRAKALQDGNVRKADAIGIDAAMHGGIFGAGTEEAEITQIYELNRREVEEEAAAKGWNTAEIQKQVEQRNGEIDTAYEEKYGDPKARAQGKPSALMTAFEDEMSGADLDLAKALHAADQSKIDAAKLGVEREGLWSSDEEINKVLENQGKRARREAERDANVDMSRRAQIDDLRGKPWDAARWRTERTATAKRIEEDTKARAKDNMAKLEGAYDSKYGKGGLAVLFVFNMSGEDQAKAWELKKNNGILPPEREIFYAVEGIGTDLDKIKEVLKGKTPDEVKAIRKAWDKKYGTGDFDRRLLDEVSGRDYRDMKWLLEGEPQTIDAKIKRAKERRDYENSAYGWGSSQEVEKAELDKEYNALVKEGSDLKALEAELKLNGESREDDLEKLRAPQGEKESDKDYAARMRKLDKLEFYQQRFSLREGYFDTTVEDHRKAIDSFADTAATIAGIVATVVVMVVAVIATVATGGTAGVAIAGALASAQVAAAAALAGAAATIATKYAIKGSAYSQQEMAIDAVVGAIDAVVSVATAGVGGGLLKAAKAGGPTSKLASWAAKTRLASGLSKMAKSERMVARVFAGAVSEGIEGVASTLPSALASNVLDENNWAKGNPLGNILQGTVIQTGMAVAIGGGLGGLGGIAKHVPEGPLTRETGDILAKRGNPADRLALWRQFKVDNPGASFKQFSEQLDAGIIAKDIDDTARHALQREMRGELLGGIPPGQRKQFADVPIEVMSDADFARFTKSASGQAVVIFKDGKPLVLLREGADFKSLREEGLHLLQSKDPKLRKAFKSLDESNLGRWNQMGLDEQLSLYKTKIDIELDAQVRLIKQLDEQLAALDDPAMRKALLAQRKAAGETFENLGKRLDELADISPTQRLKMARGEVAKPQYLDQEPRLFNKKKGPKPDLPLVAAKTRADAARGQYQAVADLITDTKAKALFGVIFQNLDGRTKSFFRRAELLMKAHKESFDTFLKSGTKGGRFDASLAMKSFAAAIKDVVAAGDPQRLRDVLHSIETLVIHGKRKVDVWIGHLEPFFIPLAKVKNPKKLLGLIEEMAELVSYRRKMLPELGDLMQTIASKKPKLLDEFVDTIKELSSAVKKRDGLAKGTAAWAKAQDAVVEASKALQRKRKYGIDAGKLSKVLEEFSRTGQFNADAYMEILTDQFPLDSHKFGAMKKLVEKLRSNAKNWSPLNVGPILQWSDLIKDLPKAKQAKLIKQIDDYLGVKLVGKMTENINSNYRKMVRKAVIENIVEGKTARARTTAVLELLSDMRKDGKQPGVIGSFWAEFCTQVFKGPPNAIKGDLAGVKFPSLRSVNYGGTGKMVDGALDMPAGGKLPKGRHLVDAKAGASLDVDQALLYDKHIRAGTLTTSDSGLTKGLVYLAESMDEALKKVKTLDSLGCHPSMRVVALDPKTNKFKLVPRPNPPKANAPGVKSKKVKK